MVFLLARSGFELMRIEGSFSRVLLLRAAACLQAYTVIYFIPGDPEKRSVSILSDPKNIEIVFILQS